MTIWVKGYYEEKDVKCHAIMRIATKMHRQASDKEFLYGNFDRHERPYEPHIYDGSALNWLRSWTGNLVSLSLRMDMEELEDELVYGKEKIRKYGTEAGHIRTSGSSGVWGIRQSNLYNMIAALKYTPLALPGDEWVMRAHDESIWNVTLEWVGTSGTSRDYCVFLFKEHGNHERFTANEGYSSFYWSMVKHNRERYVPYPFEALVEERVKNGQGIGIQV